MKFSLIVMFLSFITNVDSIISSQIKSYLEKLETDFDEILFVSIDNQKMYHFKKQKIISTYVISSSKYGVGNQSGSNKTPKGLHFIKKKIGDNTPINGKIIGRKFTGEIAKIFSDKTISDTVILQLEYYGCQG